MQKNNMFITLEGIEGSGKSTQVGPIVDYLTQKGRDCTVTREPGGTRIGEKIRSILMDSGNNDLDPLAELLLYMADRAQHIREVIRPALDAGKTVICDRYVDATVVYQGYARGLDVDFILSLHRIILDDLKPDLTLLLDLPAKTGLKRAWQAVDSGDRLKTETRFEQEAIDFHQRVRDGYLTLSAAEPLRFAVIDASLDRDRVCDDILEVISKCTSQY
jgi:dTMP kinase